jgi:predicted RNase H-like nuclease
LEKKCFIHSPHVQRKRPVRQVVEVFPHPAMIELFGLPKILRYKARPGRSQALRWRELRRFRELLFRLACAEPAMEGEAILRAAEPWGKRGKELKALEDLLDALFCAYIGLHLWYWGPAGYRLFGDEKTGYILVPVRPNAR